MVQETVNWLAEWGSWAVLISLVINVVVNLLGFVPSIFVTGANVLLWGPFWGGAISLIGEALGSGLAFLLYRKGWRHWSCRISPSWRWMENLNRWPRRLQFKSLLAARLTPFIPSGAINLLGALTTVRFSDFFLATFIGKIPSIALEVLVSHDVIHIQENGLRLAFVLLALLLAVTVWHSLQKERR
ncbi:TVP38/TMEM64 family protein [Salinithrix halophila]|uniref:TVP38/TMEM64 family membrane protein n=1 Tax=Salinithrix halophila TaxID=1485204 RepID=A0ABV8JCB8_9BACL